MKKWAFAIVGVAVVIALIAVALQSNIFANPETVLAEKTFAQIEDYEVRTSGDTVLLSIKTKADVPDIGEDFQKLNIISFGYAWLSSNDGLSGVFANVHTVGGFVGPWHAELIELVQDDTRLCLRSEPMINEVSSGDNLVRVILSKHQLDFSSHEIDMAVSVALVENLSCISGFEAKIITEFHKRPDL